MERKHLIAAIWCLIFIAWRAIEYLSSPPSSSPGLGTVEGLAFMENRCYQRGVTVHLIRTDSPQPTISFPLSYSGTLKRDMPSSGGGATLPMRMQR